MKITKRQLRRIIREEKTRLLRESGRHDPDSGYDELRQDRDDEELYGNKGAAATHTPENMLNSLKQPSAGAKHGVPFYRLVAAAMDNAEYDRAANYIMDALMIDDIFDEDEQDLIDMLSKNSSQNINHMKLIPQIMADWMSRF